MKNLMMAVVFLFSQVGYSFEKPNLINSKGYHLENEKLSSLILSKEEFSHLTDKEKSTYMFSLIALDQFVEAAQMGVAGYADSNQVIKSSSHGYEKIELFFSSLNQAHALAPLAVGAGWFLLETAAGLAIVAGAKAIVKKMTVKALEKTPSLGKVAAGSIARKLEAEGIKKGSKEAVQIGEDVVKAAVKRRQLTDQLFKANRDPKKRDALLKEAVDAEKDFKNASWLFTGTYGGSAKALAQLTKEGGLTSYLTKKNLAILTAAGFTTYGVNTAMVEALGLSPTGLASGLFESASDADKAGDSSKSAGKSCVFGGHPSVWKNFDGQVACTRPEASKSSQCNGDNQFLCQSYGITLAEGSLDSELCIQKMKLDDLTVRCSQKLLSVLDEKKIKAKVNEDKFHEFEKQLKEVLVRLEKTPSMTDEEGHTKTIMSYCAAENVAQVDECSAIKHILSFLKDTHYPTVLAARPTAVAEVEATPSSVESVPAAK
jgi:hypothetical protein